MTLFADSTSSTGQLVLAAVLAAAGFFLLLPRPRHRHVVAGIAACIAAAAVGGAWLYRTFGDPMPDRVGNFMFWLFAAGAVGFGTVLVTQRNPARGAIAFAFVILSTCGLFLLLAAPFLMAATVIIYAGAIIVTFLFVLMLSNVAGMSDENDRTREPLFGSLAGFAFASLVLFTLHQTQQSVAATEPTPGVAPKPLARLPAPALTPEERQGILAAVGKIDEVTDTLDAADLGNAQARVKWVDALETDLEPLLKATTSVTVRLTNYRTDAQAKAVLARAAAVRTAVVGLFTKLEGDAVAANAIDKAAAKADLRAIRDDAVLLNGAAELPARNVANLGYLLYADYLLAVELAGTLLLVATVGAVAIAQRKGSGVG